MPGEREPGKIWILDSGLEVVNYVAKQGWTARIFSV